MPPLQPELPLVGDVAGNMITKIAERSRMRLPPEKRLPHGTEVLLVHVMGDARTTVPQQNKPVWLHARAFPIPAYG
jgi:hypothetical protein